MTTARMPQIVWLGGWFLAVTTPWMLAGCANGRSGCKGCALHSSPGSLAMTTPASPPWFAMGRPAAAPSAPPQLASQGVAPYGGQRTCPVTGEKLGSMGAPVPVSVKGQTVFVCCQGCAADVQKNPDTYLAKVAAERAGP